MRTRRLVAVWDSDAGLIGDLSYLFRKLVRGQGCALCDISHGAVRPKSAWTDLTSRFDPPLEARYRDQLEPEAAAACGHAFPCVLAMTDRGWTVVLTRDQLEACEGDVARFEAALRAALR